jgi:hypothetical protein
MIEKQYTIRYDKGKEKFGSIYAEISFDEFKTNKEECLLYMCENTL